MLMLRIRVKEGQLEKLKKGVHTEVITQTDEM